MNSDCTVGIDDGLINIRVGAIIMKDNKFLMVGNERQDYLYSVGGRVKFGETAGWDGNNWGIAFGNAPCYIDAEKSICWLVD